MAPAPMPNSARSETFLWFVIAAVGGFLCVVIPNIVFDKGTTDYPFVRDAIENMYFLPVAVLLFALGGFLGWNCPRHWWTLGLTTMAAFPIVASVEMTLDPKSHNLWPIEFFMYALISVPAQLGALTGRTGVRRYKPGSASR